MIILRDRLQSCELMSLTLLDDQAETCLLRHLARRREQQGRKVRSILLLLSFTRKMLSETNEISFGQINLLASCFELRLEVIQCGKNDS